MTSDRSSRSSDPLQAKAPAPAVPAVPGFYVAGNWQAEDSIGLLMKQSAMGIGREIQERLHADDVTYGQWPALALLSQGRARTAADLARELQTDAGAMTRMLDRLEEKGLVTRTRGGLDRRVALIELTEEGKAAVEPIQAVLAAVLNEALRGFSRAEFEQFRAYLRRVHGNVRAMCKGPPDQPSPAEESNPS